MTIVDYNAGTVKDMGLAQAKVVTMDDKTTMEITLNPGFDWKKEGRIYLSIDRQNQIADRGPPLLLPIGVPQAPRLPRVVPRQPFRLPPGRHHEGPVQGRLHRDGQRRLQLQHSPRCVRLEKSFIFVLKLWRLNIPFPLLLRWRRPPPRGHRRRPLRDGRVLPEHRRRREGHEGLRAADFAARIHRDHPGLATSYFRSTGEKNSRENQSEIQQLLMGHLQ